MVSFNKIEAGDQGKPYFVYIKLRQILIENREISDVLSIVLSAVFAMRYPKIR